MHAANRAPMTDSAHDDFHANGSTSARIDPSLLGRDLPPLPTLRPLHAFRRLNEPEPIGFGPATVPTIPTQPTNTPGMDDRPVVSVHGSNEMAVDPTPRPPSESAGSSPNGIAASPNQAGNAAAPNGSEAPRRRHRYRDDHENGFSTTALEEEPAVGEPASVAAADETVDESADLADQSGESSLAAELPPADTEGEADSDRAVVPAQDNEREDDDLEDEDLEDEDPETTLVVRADVIAEAIARHDAGRHSRHAAEPEPTRQLATHSATLASPSATTISVDPSHLVARRILVVGAGTTGASVAAALADTGLQIAVSDAAGEPGPDLAAALPGSGHHVFVAGDYTDPAGVSRILQEVIDGLGGLDVVVYAAGIHQDVSADESAEEWAETYGSMLTINLLGAATVAQGASRLFRNLGVPGRIVLLATGGGTAMGRSVAQGLVGLGTGLAAELAGHGVEVTVVEAGPASSSLSSDFGSPLAGTVSWLVSRPAGVPAPVHISLPA